MTKYRIKVEALDENVELNQKYIDGIEAEGFCMLVKREDEYMVAVEGMCVEEIADAMSRDAKVTAAGIIAKAKREAIDMCAHDEMGNALRNLRRLV